MANIEKRTLKYEGREWTISEWASYAARKVLGDSVTEREIKLWGHGMRQRLHKQDRGENYTVADVLFGKRHSKQVEEIVKDEMEDIIAGIVHREIDYIKGDLSTALYKAVTKETKSGKGVPLTDKSVTTYLLDKYLEAYGMGNLTSYMVARNGRIEWEDVPVIDLDTLVQEPPITLREAVIGKFSGIDPLYLNTDQFLIVLRALIRGEA